MAESGHVRTPLIVLSLVAELVGIAAIVVSWATNAPYLGYRLIAAVLLMDQAMLALLYIKLPALMPGVRLALRAGSVFSILLGAVLVVGSALKPAGVTEIAMPVVGLMMIVHAAFTLRYLATASPSETT